MLEEKILSDFYFKSNYGNVSELAELLNVPESEIALYTDWGILPYTNVKVGRHVVKYYDKEDSRQRLKHIRVFRKKGKSIANLKALYRDDVSKHEFKSL